MINHPPLTPPVQGGEYKYNGKISLPNLALFILVGNV